MDGKNEQMEKVFNAYGKLDFRELDRRIESFTQEEISDLITKYSENEIFVNEVLKSKTKIDAQSSTDDKGQSSTDDKCQSSNVLKVIEMIDMILETQEFDVKSIISTFNISVDDATELLNKYKGNKYVTNTVKTYISSRPQSSPMNELCENFSGLNMSSGNQFSPMNDVGYQICNENQYQLTDMEIIQREVAFLQEDNYLLREQMKILRERIEELEKKNEKVRRKCSPSKRL